MKMKNGFGMNSPDITYGSDGSMVISQMTVSNDPLTPRSIVPKIYVDNLTDPTCVMPGRVVLRPFKTTPSGYLKCNGSAVSRTDYANLYNAIGDAFSSFPVKGSGQPWTHQYGINITLDSLVNRSWYKASNLPVSNVFASVVVTKNRVYLLGRYSGTAYGSGIYTAPIDANGVVGAWSTSALTLPQAMAYFQTAVINNYLYVIGGYNGTYKTNIYRAVINSDGTLGTFAAFSNLPVTLSHFQALITKNRIYLIGGYAGGVPSSKVYMAPIDTSGNIGTWSLGPSLNVPLYSHCATIIRDRIYVMGGATGAGGSKAVYYAPINPDGTIDSWLEDFSLPDTLYSSSLICSRNMVYLFGGIYQGAATNLVHGAIINADGTLGAWNPYDTLIEQTYGVAAFTTSGGIYLLGGYLNGILSNKVNTLDYIGGLSDYSSYYAPATSELPNGMFRLPDYSFLEPYRLYAFIRY